MPLICRLGKVLQQHKDEHSCKGKTATTTTYSSSTTGPVKYPPECGGMCWMKQTDSLCNATGSLVPQTICVVRLLKTTQAANIFSLIPFIKCKISTSDPWNTSPFTGSCSSPTSPENPSLPPNTSSYSSARTHFSSWSPHPTTLHCPKGSWSLVFPLLQFIRRFMKNWALFPFLTGHSVQKPLQNNWSISSFLRQV